MQPALLLQKGKELLEEGQYEDAASVLELAVQVKSIFVNSVSAFFLFNEAEQALTDEYGQTAIECAQAMVLYG